MKYALLAMSLASAATFGAILDRTIVIKGTDVRVHAVQFERRGLVVTASICAHAPQADGGEGLGGCESVELPNGPLKTAVTNMMDGPTLMLWRTSRSLEN